jgi:hypothetical protein
VISKPVSCEAGLLYLMGNYFFQFSVIYFVLRGLKNLLHAKRSRSTNTSGGFVRIHNRVPQVWSVRGVEQNKDGSILIHDLDIKNGAGKLEIDFSNLNSLVVFVIGQTRYTTLPASYQVEVSPQ